MILVSKYCRTKDSKGHGIIWSLVSCDNSNHIGERRRLARRSDLQQGDGVHKCKKCMTKTLSQSRIGKKDTLEARRIRSERMKGQKQPPELVEKRRIANTGKRRTQQSRDNISKGRIGKYAGPNSPNWNPNLTDQDRRERRDNRYHDRWKKSVKRRDNYTCQISKLKGISLDVHHLYSYADFHDKRYEVNNGITISRKLHTKFHQLYGQHNNVPEQFYDFVNIVLSEPELYGIS